MPAVGPVTAEQAQGSNGRGVQFGAVYAVTGGTGNFLSAGGEVVRTSVPHRGADAEVCHRQF
ncbi:hypothetical protein ACWC4D_40470 [Streptomyces sp. NPDC001288]|uniref:hypothetical protein n=1 Tax=Streptomyces sp. NPDC001297 TaxID=3364559 RepID=UPI00368878A8